MTDLVPRVAVRDHLTADLLLMAVRHYLNSETPTSDRMYVDNVHTEMVVLRGELENVHDSVVETEILGAFAKFFGAPAPQPVPDSLNDLQPWEEELLANQGNSPQDWVPLVMLFWD